MRILASQPCESHLQGRPVSHFLAEIEGAHPIGRIAEPEEVARLYVYCPGPPGAVKRPQRFPM